MFGALHGKGQPRELSKNTEEDEALRGLEKFWPRVKRLAVEVHGSHLLKKLKEGKLLLMVRSKSGYNP